MDAIVPSEALDSIKQGDRKYLFGRPGLVRGAISVSIRKKRKCYDYQAMMQAIVPCTHVRTYIGIVGEKRIRHSHKLPLLLLFEVIFHPLANWWQAIVANLLEHQISSSEREAV